MRSLVIGATGIVGGYIVGELVARGERPLALSRASRASSDHVEWIKSDLADIANVSLPEFSTLYCTVHARSLAKALPALLNPSLRRVVLFTSTSIETKINSDIATERDLLRDLKMGETQVIEACEASGIEWTILRPTLIYAEGRDGNVSRLAGLGKGLRQPVHAEDLAIGAIAAAASPAAANKTYALPGKDTLTYHEMAGRIFDALGKPRRIVPVPPALWRAAFAVARPFFPNANAAMGTRMAKDMVFDATPAITDFGWAPRGFQPRFVSTTA